VIDPVSDGLPDPARHRFGYLPWEYHRNADDETRTRQVAYQRLLADRIDAEFAETAYVDETSAMFASRLRMGERSYFAAYTYVTGSVEMGDDCTVNPFTIVRGPVTMGTAVRVGAHASLLGFNHSIAPDRFVFKQPTTSKGITIGDDVWIGSSVTVLDGVHIGDHAVVGACAVVTKDVAEWAVVAGNPARPIRDRREAKRRATSPAPSADGLGEDLVTFVNKARTQLPDILDRCYDGTRFLDVPGATPNIRGWCDAVELADLLLHRAPDQHGVDDLVERLQRYQQADTGLIPAADLADGGGPQGGVDLFHGPATYHLLCVGYALKLLGSGFRYPIRAFSDIDPADLDRRLDELPWQRQAWSCGNTIDGLGTALLHNVADFGETRNATTLFGWLGTRVDRSTGVWGAADPENGRWQIINGFYRLTRGTYAQFGIPLPEPEAAVQTILAHADDRRFFVDAHYTACNVLDVIHPLWLVAKDTDLGRGEGKRWVREQIPRLLSHWVDGEGFPFAPFGERNTPSLQGTEMWLATLWLMADYLGIAGGLGYRPRGVHRPEAALGPADLLTGSRA
jgi:acetyltransferase-like isoleucine patch superfamily enzyme